MSDKEQEQQELKEVLPKAGLVISETGNLKEVLCKPKILPLKSITLQKLEDMEAKILEVNKQQQASSSKVVDSMAAYAAAARKENSTQ